MPRFHFSVALLITLLPFGASLARAADPAYLTAPSITSVDLRDLAEFAPGLLPEAAAVMDSLKDSLKKNPTLYHLAAADQLMGVELIETPVPRAAGARLRIVAFVKSLKQGYFFRKCTVELSTSPFMVTAVDSFEDVPLAKTHFQLRASLFQRKAILEDPEHGLRKIYPLEVGGIDPALKFTRNTGSRPAIITPVLTHAHLERAMASESRHSIAPDYYHGLPFMPITRADGMVLPIAFHTIPDPQMVRGFESHGCLRLRSRDLKELYAILAHGGSARLPVEVSLQLPEMDDHPYPFEDTSYQIIRDCDRTGKTPHYCRDSQHYLTELDPHAGRPPFADLTALDGDRMSRADYALEIDAATGLPGQRSQDPFQLNLLNLDLPPETVDERRGTQRGT